MPTRQNKKPCISSKSLNSHLHLEQQIEVARRWTQALQNALGEVDKDIIAQLKKGHQIPSGYEASVRRVERRNVSWKSEFVERLGAKAAQKVLDSTKPDIFRELEVPIGDRRA
jgi:hypothetical protein